ncbi:tape measure protein [Niallia circulans]|uniref:Tape measure protein n=1 Tax=Niallia circulans TaxID=1397 RepID=A0A941G8L8_NIACI|nr:tape measure protein [Niallia circulans]MCB5235513.1 tape measure protein [Niallia circulans]
MAADGSVVIEITIDDTDVSGQIRDIDRDFNRVGSNFPQIFRNNMRQIRTSLGQIRTNISDTFSAAANSIRNTFTRANPFRSMFTGLQTATSGITSRMTSGFSNAFSRIRTSASNSIGRMRQDFSNLDRSVQNPLKSMLTMAATITGITGAMNLMGRAISRVDTIDTATKSLTVLTGSTEDAKLVMNDLVDAIDGTPIALNDVALGAKKMVAAGMKAEKVKPVFKSIADAAYGVGDGAQSIDQITSAIASMQSAGVVYADDINRLVDAGIPAWQMLANQTDMSVSDIKKYTSKGLLESNDAIDMLVEGIQNGTDGVAGSTAAMAGLAKTAGDTISGSFGNMKTAIVKIMANVADVLKGDIIDSLKGLTNAFKAVGRVTASEGFANGLRGMVDALKLLSPALLGVVTALAIFSTYMGLTKAVGALRMAIAGLLFTISANPVVAIVAALAGLAVMLVTLYKTNETFRNAVQKTWNFITDMYEKSVEGIKTALSSIMPALQAFGSWTGDKLIAGFSWLGSIGVKAISAIATGLAIAGDAISSFFDYLANSAVGQAVLNALKLSFENITNVLLTLVPFLSRLALGFIGVTGPLGLAISLAITFAATLLKMGGFSAEGINKALKDIGKTLMGILDTALVLIPQFIKIGADLIVKLMEGIAQSIPKLVSVAEQLMNMLNEAIITYLPIIIEVGLQIITAIADGIVQYLPIMINAIISIVTFLVDTIAQYLPTIISVGITILTNLLEGILTVLPEVINTAILIITSLLGILIDNLPMILSAGIDILNALIGGVIAALPALLTAALTIIISLATALLDNLPQLLSAGIELLMALIDGILSILPMLIETALTLIITLATAVIKALPQIIAAGIKILNALIQGIVQLIPALIACALKLIITLVGAIIKNLPQILSAGVKILKMLVQGILSIIGTLIKAGAELIVRLIQAIAKQFPKITAKGKEIPGIVADGIKSAISKMVSIGEDIISGIVKGIGNGFGWVKSKISELGGNITGWATSILKIKSPSRVMRDKVGKWIPAGIAVGIDADASEVEKSMDRMLKIPTNYTAEAAVGINGVGLLDKLKATVNASNIINSNYDDSKVTNLLKQIADKDSNVYLDDDKVGSFTDKDQAMRTFKASRRLAT